MNPTETSHSETGPFRQLASRQHKLESGIQGNRKLPVAICPIGFSYLVIAFRLEPIVVVLQQTEILDFLNMHVRITTKHTYAYTVRSVHLGIVFGAIFPFFKVHVPSWILVVIRKRGKRPSIRASVKSLQLTCRCT